ncbi:MAG: long-chain fatty acid--CoA ligase [Rhodocyclaceae bacterium]|nr:MAG: long-chain fatty acid--CoA ligase [Rhodocyclaceae bacterium]
MALNTWIAHHAGQTPDKLALRFPGRELSYLQLAALVEQVSASLVAGGVLPGRCVAYLGYNSPEMLALLFACARLGAMFMPLNWRLAAPEHRQMLADCPPTVIFVEAPFLAQSQEFVVALKPAQRVSFGQAPTGWTSYQSFLAQAQGSALGDSAVRVGAPLLICYTSGSTGKPKGVVLSQNALVVNAANSIAMHDMTAADRILTTLPLFHVGGLNILTTPALQAGASVVLHPKFEPDAAYDAIERESITLTVLVPAQLEMMTAHPRWRSADLSSLRMITTGSSIVPERLIRAVHERGVPLVQVYGSTETCPIATYQKRDEAQRKIGSAGRPAANCEVRVVDDAGKDLGPANTGEILVRGANVMTGYWRDLQATASALRDGWFHSGDMGHWDADGFLYVDGRRKEMIISGGENIYPAEIENILIECDAIAEAAVVGRPDRRWGEVVVAVVVPKSGSGLSKEQVLQLFDGRIARYKHPKDVVFAGELPKTALGKVRKEEVRNLASGTMPTMMES